MIEVYIASPYSHPCPTTREIRYIRTMHYMNRLLEEGVTCISPIVTCHVLASIYNLGKDAETWKTLNKAYLSSCERVHVLELSGWGASIGVRQEVEWAKAQNKEVEYVPWSENF